MQSRHSSARVLASDGDRFHGIIGTSVFRIAVPAWRMTMFGSTCITIQQFASFGITSRMRTNEELVDNCARLA
eukprot:4527613-Pleurochrysis_carterae.AAC.3